MKTFTEFSKEKDTKKKQQDTARAGEDTTAGDSARINTALVNSTVDQVAITKEPNV